MHTNLYAPWRDSYVKGDAKKSDCVFCDIVANKDHAHANHVLFWHEEYFVVMNKFPYTPGHIMIIPTLHQSDIEALPQKVWAHISAQIPSAVRLLKDLLNAQGVNVGINLGEAAGAGIAPHLHVHLVPRYVGDTNFITTIGESRVYSTEFEALYEKLAHSAHSYFKH